MDKARKAGSFSRSIVVLAIVAICVLVLGSVLVLGHSRGSTTTVRSPASTSTVPYDARPGANGTKVLTEPVDQLTLAVPAGWTSPAPDSLTLPDQLDKFAREAPSLAALLQAEGQVAGKSAVRLFAYQPGAPHAFVSVISFSSPGADALTPTGVDAMIAAAKAKTPNVAVSGARLPVGQVVKLDSTLVVRKQAVVVEDLILIAGGRTMLVEMVSETDVAALPPVFAQIAQSLGLR